MSKYLPLCILLAACSNSTGTEQAGDLTKAECTFKFVASPQCSYRTRSQTFNVALVTRKLADDEIGLIEARVSVDGKSHTLALSPDTSMIEGDIGTIRFDDLNFDGVTDLAVATSFGAANQYLDYWIYEPMARKYLPLGNLPRLLPVLKDRTLHATVKVNAAKSETQIYSLIGNKLERRK